MKQHKYLKAIKVLSPEMFSYENWMASFLVEKLYRAYLEVYSKEELHKEFKNIEEHLIIKTRKYKGYIFKNADLKIFKEHVSIPVDGYKSRIGNTLNTDIELKNQCINKIRKSEIYKLATIE